MNIIKKINNVSEVKDYFKKEIYRIPENILDTFQDFLSCKKVQEFGNIKKKGFSAVNILTTLLILPFAGMASIRALFFSGLYNADEGEKDVYYRLKNNENINWRKLLYSIAKRFLYLVRKNSNADDDKDKVNKITCLIGDDTVLQKLGESIEYIGKVFDHSIGKSILGFKLLVIGFWDGVSFIPLNFSLHREKGKNKQKPYGLPLKKLRKQFSKKREKSSLGYKRTSELNKSKIDVLLQMIKSSVKHGFVPNYVLVDKWFFCEKVVRVVRLLKKGAVHLLGPCTMGNRKYIYQGKEYTAKALLKKLKKNFKRCRSLHSHYIRVIVIYKGHKLCLFFNRSFNTKKWQLLVTTNLSLNFRDAMEIYSIRWTIEVFFKEMKQHLNLGKCQARDFDSQIADATIAMIRYIMIAYLKRFRDYETLGGIFSDTKKFIIEYNLAEKIWGLLCEIIRSIAELFEMPINRIMRKLFNNPQFEKTIFKFISDDYIETEITDENKELIDNVI